MSRVQISQLANASILIHEFLSALDIFVMPSLWQGQQIALLEALAIGKPCIASSVDDISEIFTNNINGYLIAQNMAKAIASIYMNKARLI